jgi:hypothetical protein
MKDNEEYKKAVGVDPQTYSHNKDANADASHGQSEDCSSVSGDELSKKIVML